MAKELLTLENAVKLSVLSLFFWGIFSGISDIKTDIALLKQAKKFEIENLQSQITELKFCCNENRNGTGRRPSYNNSTAIIPNNIEVKDED